MSVVDRRPAADAGLRSGDIILEVDDRPIEGGADLQGLMVGEALGGPMQVRVWRDGGIHTIPVRPVELEVAQLGVRGGTSLRCPQMANTYSVEEIATEAACTLDRVEWIAQIGLIAPEDGRFTLGAVLAVKMVSALLESGVPAGSIERAATEGLLSFQRTDEYLPYEPGRRAHRTFTEFQETAGPRAQLLPAIYEVLGLAKPDPSAPIHVDEEAIFERFLDTWAMAPDDDALIRAARLMGQGTRAAMLGWMDLQDEQLAQPARIGCSAASSTSSPTTCGWHS